MILLSRLDELMDGGGDYSKELQFALPGKGDGLIGRVGRDQL